MGAFRVSQPWCSLCLPQMFVQVAEVMGKHYGMVPIQVRHPFLNSLAQTPTCPAVGAKDVFSSSTWTS